MEKETQNKDAKIQQPKGIILHLALVDSLVGKVAGFKKQNKHPTKKKKKKIKQPPQNTPHKKKPHQTKKKNTPTNSTGIPTCQKLFFPPQRYSRPYSRSTKQNLV